jgi:hypothetical protein
MPIHCQKCKNCEHEFHMNHKPKKVKETVISQTLYSFDSVMRKGKSVSIILDRNEFFGHMGQKNYKRDRTVLPLS